MMGKRTIHALIISAIPTRIYFLLAVLALFAAFGMALLSYILYHIAPEWLANEAQSYARTFRAMPLWFMIGGSLSQVAARINIAIDDYMSWRKMKKIEDREKIRDATDGLPVKLY